LDKLKPDFLSDNVTYMIYWGFSWLRHYATSWKVAGSFPDDVIGFFNCPNPSSRTMDLGSIQILTDMSTRNLHGSKGQPARKADNLTAICEPIVDVQQPCGPQRPVTRIALLFSSFA
jgi:hypothetical protein